MTDYWACKTVWQSWRWA